MFSVRVKVSYKILHDLGLGCTGRFWMLFGGCARGRRPGLHRRGWGSDAKGAYLSCHLGNAGRRFPKWRLSGFASTPSSRARGEPRNASKRRRAIVLRRHGPVVAIWPGFVCGASVSTHSISQKLKCKSALGRASRAHARKLSAIFVISSAGCCSDREN